MVSVQIRNDLKASVQRNNLALDLLLQNSEFHIETVNLEFKGQASSSLPDQPHADLALKYF